MVRRHLWVSGRVQGVWYGGGCAQRAHALGVSGWARNLPDGRVEIAVEGEPEAVDKLVEWCHGDLKAARIYGRHDPGPRRGHSLPYGLHPSRYAIMFRCDTRQDRPTTHRPPGGL
jgi:acylphosphatase